eukprot:1853996-Pyramimonas_sp.AAC.2
MSDGHACTSDRAAVRMRCTYSERKSLRNPLNVTPRAMHQSSSVMSLLPRRCLFKGPHACRPDSRVASQAFP